MARWDCKRVPFLRLLSYCNQDSTLRSYFSPGYAELCSSEERHELRRFYDTEPVAGRGRWSKSPRALN